MVTTNRLRGGYRPEGVPRCSASIMPPRGDLVVGVFGALGTGDAVKEERARPEARREWGDAATGAAISIALLASAIYGWQQVERCDEARDAHDRWLEKHGYRGRRRVAMLEGGGRAR